MWRLYVPGHIKRTLERIPKREQDKIIIALDFLKASPFDGDIKKLGEDTYRRRVGEYRIIYRTDKKLRVVIVGSIARRTSATY